MRTTPYGFTETTTEAAERQFPPEPTPTKITITLEGESWRDILREMSIIEASVRGSRIEDLPEQPNIAKDCQKCRNEHLGRLQWVLGEYFLGPEERAEILERVRQ